MANEGPYPFQNFNNGNLIANNVIINSGYGSLMLGSYGLAGGGVQNSIIANNVFYNSWNVSAVNIPGGSNYPYNGLLIANNIFYESDGDMTAFGETIDGPITFANNNWYAGIPNSIAQSNKDVDKSPSLINPTTYNPGDYSLQNNSPCISAGIIIPQITTDFNGNSRPKNSPYDIGAFQVSDLEALQDQINNFLTS